MLGRSNLQTFKSPSYNQPPFPIKTPVLTHKNEMSLPPALRTHETTMLSKPWKYPSVRFPLPCTCRAKLLLGFKALVNDTTCLAGSGQSWSCLGNRKFPGSSFAGSCCWKLNMPLGPAVWLSWFVSGGPAMVGGAIGGYDMGAAAACSTEV
jgi:hypothetical protein